MATGIATYYSKGVFQEVYENRLRWGHVAPCLECVGMTAVIDCGRLGEKVWLKGPGDWEGPFLVTDCSAARDRRRHEQIGLVADVDWETGRRWDMHGPIACEIMYEEQRAGAAAVTDRLK